MPFSLFFCIKIVTEYRRMVVYRLGRVPNRRPKGPGVVFLLPCIDDYRIVDLRTMSYDVPSQEMLTRDSVTVSVDAAVYYRTHDPVASISAITDAHYSTKQLAQTTLRNLVGTRTLTEMMADREGIAIQAKFILDTATHLWGITVERVEIKDIRLPTELCRSMAAEAEAVRESDAKYVCAQGELNASMALKAAADELSESEGAVQLRVLQSLTKISAVDNHTVILPIPVDLIRAVMKKVRPHFFANK
ncbi:unnamed protein product, partial [Mesorhabditis belari]|uniref:Band 7 domain-containing protein n=1 Tax=Mesorhabditis belari TaxID=2138241 RepID=A0AAF3EHS2_9BILA